MPINEGRLRLGLNALRSGEYEQGFSVLCDQSDRERPRFCCLGVLTEVARMQGCPVHVIENGGNRTYITPTTYFDSADEKQLGLNYDHALMPDLVRQWYGFDAANPVIGNHNMCATEANDTHKLSFTEIADLFEKKFLTPTESENGTQEKDPD